MKCSFPGGTTPRAATSPLRPSSTLEVAALCTKVPRGQWRPVRAPSRPRTRREHLQGRGRQGGHPEGGPERGSLHARKKASAAWSAARHRPSASSFSNATNCSFAEGGQGRLEIGGTASRCDWPASCASFADRLALTVWWEVPALPRSPAMSAAHMPSPRPPEPRHVAVRALLMSLRAARHPRGSKSARRF